MDSYNIAYEDKYPFYYQFCEKDEDCEALGLEGAECKEGIGVLDPRQHNWF